MLKGMFFLFNKYVNIIKEGLISYLVILNRELHELSMQKRREQVDMTQADSELFKSYLANVQREIRELRVILESIEAKNNERIWLKNQSSGDVDDTKL